MTHMDLQSQSMPNSGIWKRDKILGAGGFGTVALYTNQETGDTLALKQCRLTVEMTERHKQRWHKEVDIMLKLDHINVVKGIQVPSSVQSSPGELPVMGMEYCEGGDLRKMLNKPENCCGVKESVVKGIVRDISSAIEYLHSARIIHRDLKPENIVLQNIDEQTVYKVIDLGYAKDLDEGSVCTSFVGTLQYLAPELFDSRPYNCTVDYWSFGTLVFECINGYRPFLPTMAPLQWHNHVKKKKNEDICVYYDSKGEITYSSTMPKPNHLCRTLQMCFEQFLRLLLIWNANHRGGGLTPKKRPKCFQLLDAILDIKVVFVYSVPTNQVLSYRVSEETLGFLQTLIQQETGIPVAEQELLLASGIPPDVNQNVSMFATDNTEGEGLIFLFRSGGGIIDSHYHRDVPELVQEMLAEPNTMYTFQEQKKIWSHAVYFISEVARDHKRLLHAQRAAMMSLLRTNSRFSKFKSRVQTDCEHLQAQVHFFQASLALDLFKYEEQSKEGVSSQKLKTSWKDMEEDIKKASMLQREVTELEQLCTALMTRILELQRSPFAKAKQPDSLDTLESRIIAQYDKFRKTGKDKRHLAPDNGPVVTCIHQCFTDRGRLTKDLYTHIGKVLECHGEVHKLLPRLELKVAEMKRLSDRLLTMQKQRQHDMWYLLRLVIQQRVATSTSSSLASSMTESATSPTKPTGLIHSPGSTTSATTTPPGSSTVRPIQQSTASSTAQSSLSSESEAFFQKLNQDCHIIKSQNISTRSRIEHVVRRSENNQSECPSMVQSMNWDFLQRTKLDKINIENINSDKS